MPAKTALVLGGGGFIGSHLVKRLKHEGFWVRAADLKRMAKTLADSNPEQAKWYAISEKLEKQVWDLKKLNCNVDFYSASVLYTLGIPTDLFTTMFAASRMAGWTAHVLEQYGHNRLIRPVSLYTGLSGQTYIPIQKRA